MREELSRGKVATFSTDGRDLYVDGHKVVKAFESFTGWYWFATEKVEERKKGVNGSLIPGVGEVDDVIWFGFVQGMEEEWGNFSEAEIRLVGWMAWEIERCDLPFAGKRSMK